MNNVKKRGKIIIFDMDETIIYAKQIYIFWTNINEYFIEYCFNQMDFNIFLNLYPEIFRPYIFKILNYIKNKKIKNECKSVIIYTNNQCGSSWVNYIKNYLEYKINYPFFFDVIINAYKINGIINEKCRKTNFKSFNDLINCSSCYKNHISLEDDDFFFIDDIYFNKMNKPNVFYVNIEKYIYNYNSNELYIRFIENNYFKNILKINLLNPNIQINLQKNLILTNYNNINKIINDKHLYYSISYKELVNYLKNFFNDKYNNFTKIKKKKFIKFSKTRKKKIT
jgi:hypothetical protein